MARTSRNQMIERAAELRAAACSRRAKGWHTGKRATGHDWQRPELDRDCWHDAARVAFDGWRAVANEALNDFAAACLSGPGADLELV